jgi:hypothetical protein
VIDNFYLAHQSTQAGGPSLLDIAGKKVQHILLDLYAQSLSEMKSLLDDSRIYIEQYFYSDAGKSITYHCWFLLEMF